MIYLITILQLGKPVRRDAQAEKSSFVDILGIEGAQLKAQSLIDDACAALAPIYDRGDELISLARFAISREY